MIIVTGGAGFIGSHIVQALNARQEDNIIIVDDLTRGQQFQNLVPLQFRDYWDKAALRNAVLQNSLKGITAIIHQGACSDTMEWDGRYMMDNNYQYSKELFEWAIRHGIPFIYASSAAVYGQGTAFSEQPLNESPVNVYGYSKLCFDNYVRHRLKDVNTQVVGLRYFNVYGSRESHKGRMASVVSQWWQRVMQNEPLRLFEGTEGYGPGEQQRDFIYVGDVAEQNLWFLEHPEISGVFNCGTGESVSFNDVAKSIIKIQGKGRIEYIPFPESLQGAYQSYTKACLAHLKSVRPKVQFLPLNEAISRSY